LKDFLALLDERFEDIKERFAERVATVPTACSAAVGWLNVRDYVDNTELALKSDSCYTLAYSGLIDHPAFVKCIQFSGDGTDFERKAIELFYRPTFKDIEEEVIKRDFEAFMRMPYTDFAKCFMAVLSTLPPNPIEFNFERV